MTDSTIPARTVPELREYLRERGLLVSGVKADLIARLEEDDARHEALVADEEDRARAMGGFLPDDEPTVLFTPADEPAVQPPVTPTTVIVVGSYEWAFRSVVADSLIGWWVAAGQPPVQLVTSGCPAGAEAIAREVGESHGWQHVTVRDEDLARVDGLAFAFVKDASAGAERVLESLRPAHWLRVLRDDTSRVVSQWGER